MGSVMSPSNDEGRKRRTPASIAASMRFVCSGILVRVMSVVGTLFRGVRSVHSGPADDDCIYGPKR